MYELKYREKASKKTSGGSKSTSRNDIDMKKVQKEAQEKEEVYK